MTQDSYFFLKAYGGARASKLLAPFQQASSGALDLYFSLVASEKIERSGGLEIKTKMVCVYKVQSTKYKKCSFRFRRGRLL